MIDFLVARLTGLVAVGAALLILVNLATFAAGNLFVAELLTHFRLHYLLAALAAILVLGLAGQRLWLVPLTIVALANGFLLWPYFAPADQSAPAGADLRLLQANILTSNRDFQGFLDLIRSERPDVIVVQETDAGWVAALSELKGLYPHQVADARPDNFGMTALSRIDGTRFEILQFTAGDVPAITISIPLNSSTVELLAVHTIPPVSGALAQTRNAQLREAATRISASASHQIIAGDLNITPWSPPFKALLESTGLRDSRIGHGYLASWPAGLGVFGIPIDHVLVSSGLDVTKLESLDTGGSDHRALLATLKIR